MLDRKFCISCSAWLFTKGTPSELVRKIALESSEVRRRSFDSSYIVGVKVVHLVHQRRKNLLSSGIVNCKILFEGIAVPLFYKFAVMFKRLLIKPVVLSLTDVKSACIARGLWPFMILSEPVNE